MPDNLSLMHRATCCQLGARAALRYKRDGLYHDLSWAEYRRQADCAAAGLIELGIQPGERVAIFAENRYEWLVADHSILSTGAANVPLHAPLSPKQVEFQLGHSGARGVFVSGREQAEKVLQVADNLPDLKFLFCFDSIGVASRLPVLTWDGLKHRGQQSAALNAGEIHKREAAIGGADLATIIYTSGTTGDPKGVMLTHGNLLSNATATLQVANVNSDAPLLSWLPYSHIYARTIDHYLTSLEGITVALAESINTLVVNLAETRPVWLTAVPRFYEKVWSNVERLPLDERKLELRRIFGPKLSHLMSGGAPLPRHVCQGFFDAGIPVLEGYGLTESSPVISFNSIEHWQIGSVGRAIPGVDVRIAADGEILTRGPHVMQGYWKNPQATAEALVDGWLHTGDVGHLDADGFLSITDRKKELIITSGGKNIAPSELERLLVSDEFIDQAVVYGDGRHFVSALIVPCFPKLQEQMEALGCPLTESGGFLREPRVLDFFAQRAAAVMESVSQPERVKKLLVLARPFQVEAEELTATLKVRRRFIVEKYKSQLAALYHDAP